MVACTFNPSAQEAGEFLWVRGQPGLQSGIYKESVFRNKQTNNNKQNQDRQDGLAVGVLLVTETGHLSEILASTR